MTNAEKRARNILRKQSTARLLDQFDLTELCKDPNIPTVRGWIMDELRARDEEAFDAWMDDEDFEASPRKYFK